MDRRKQYTQQVIKSALFNLLKKKHLNEITVKDICQLADVNRSTFYRNYLDIYDLFEKVEQELTEQAFESKNLFVDRYRLLEVIYQHQDFYREFFSARLESHYLQQMMLQLKSQVQADVVKSGHYDAESFEIEYQYNYYGVVGVINHWLQDGCPKTPQQLGQTLYAIVDRQYGNQI